METTEHTIEVLNGLIEINNDRTAGFERASAALEEQAFELHGIFNKLALDSNNNATALSALVSGLGGAVHTGSSFSGTMHRVWLGVAAVFTGQDRETVLEECERGEAAIAAAYQNALQQDLILAPDMVAMLQAQAALVNDGHTPITSLLEDAQTHDDRDDTEREVYDEYAAEHEIKDGFGRQEEPLIREHTSLPDNNTIINEDEADPQFNYESGRTGTITPEPNFSYEKNYREGDAEPDKKEHAADADSTLKEFFINELKDLLWAEEKLVDTLPKMAEAATTVRLKEAFLSHLAQTQQHVTRIEQIFELLGEESDTTKCDAMAGIVEEGENIIDDTDTGTAQRDVGLIFAGQKVEHYEIASYGGMVSLAKTLGYNDVASILAQTLGEEKEADSLLTDIAEHSVNYIASTEAPSPGLFS